MVTERLYLTRGKGRGEERGGDSNENKPARVSNLF